MSEEKQPSFQCSACLRRNSSRNKRKRVIGEKRVMICATCGEATLHLCTPWSPPQRRVKKEEIIRVPASDRKPQRRKY